MLSSMLAIVFFGGEVVRADDRDWLQNINASACWRELRNVDVNPMEDSSQYQQNGTIIELPHAKDVVAIIHTSMGTITVSKNGACSKDAAVTSEGLIAKRLGTLADEMSSFTRTGDVYQRIIPPSEGIRGGGSKMMNPELFGREMAKTRALLSACAVTEGPIGAAARAGRQRLKGGSTATGEPAGGASR